MRLDAVRMLHDAAGADIHAAIADNRRLEKEPPRDLGGPVRYHSVHIPTDGQTAIFGAARHGPQRGHQVPRRERRPHRRRRREGRRRRSTWRWRATTWSRSIRP